MVFFGYESLKRIFKNKLITLHSRSNFAFFTGDLTLAKILIKKNGFNNMVFFGYESLKRTLKNKIYFKVCQKITIDLA